MFDDSTDETDGAKVEHAISHKVCIYFKIWMFFPECAVFSSSIRHCLVFGAVAVGKIGAQEDAGDASQIEYGPDIFGEVYRDERIVQDSDAPGDDGYEAEVRILRALVAGYAKAGYSPYGGSYAEKLIVAIWQRADSQYK